MRRLSAAAELSPVGAALALALAARDSERKAMSTAEAGPERGAFEMACGWCGDVVGECRAKGSYGICRNCYPRVVRDPGLTARQVEEIPLGLMQLDARGVVLDHEDTRRRPILGQNFFTDVTPFNRVSGLGEHFRSFLASGESGRLYDIGFRAERGEILVRVFFGRVYAELALVRVKMKA